MKTWIASMVTTLVLIAGYDFGDELYRIHHAPQPATQPATQPVAPEAEYTESAENPRVLVRDIEEVTMVSMAACRKPDGTLVGYVAVDGEDVYEFRCAVGWEQFPMVKVVAKIIADWAIGG